MNIFFYSLKNWVNFVFTLYTGLKEDAMILKHHLRSSWGPWIEDKIFAVIKLLSFLMPKSIQVKKIIINL